jgi:hypothetical protein
LAFFALGICVVVYFRSVVPDFPAAGLDAKSDKI